MIPPFPPGLQEKYAHIRLEKCSKGFGVEWKFLQLGTGILFLRGQVVVKESTGPIAQRSVDCYHTLLPCSERVVHRNKYFFFLFLIFWQVGGSSAESPHGHFGALILYDLDEWWGTPATWYTTSANLLNCCSIRTQVTDFHPHFHSLALLPSWCQNRDLAFLRDAPQIFGKFAIFSSLKIEGAMGSSRILGKLKLKIANIKESGLSMS